MDPIEPGGFSSNRHVSELRGVCLKKSLCPKKYPKLPRGFILAQKKRDRGKILFEVVVPEDAFRGNDAETRGTDIPRQRAINNKH